jgi:hypothetical protein
VIPGNPGEAFSKGAPDVGHVPGTASLIKSRNRVEITSQQSCNRARVIGAEHWQNLLHQLLI